MIKRQKERRYDIVDISWKITRRKDRVMTLKTTQNDADVRAKQEFDPKYGTLTVVTITGKSESDCNVALIVLRSTYGDPDGKIKWSKNRLTLKCCWTLSFRSWNTRFEQGLGEKEIGAICDKYSLLEVSKYALYSALKALEQSTTANFDMLRHSLRS